MQKQIRTLGVYNIENIRLVIELSDEVLENINYKLDLRSNVETPINEQQQIINLTKTIMKNHIKVFCNIFAQFIKTHFSKMRIKIYKIIIQPFIYI